MAQRTAVYSAQLRQRQSHLHGRHTACVMNGESRFVACHISYTSTSIFGLVLVVPRESHHTAYIYNRKMSSPTVALRRNVIPNHRLHQTICSIVCMRLPKPAHTIVDFTSPPVTPKAKPPNSYPHQCHQRFSRNARLLISTQFYHGHDLSSSLPTIMKFAGISALILSLVFVNVAHAQRVANPFPGSKFIHSLQEYSRSLLCWRQEFSHHHSPLYYPSCLHRLP